VSTGVNRQTSVADTKSILLSDEQLAERQNGGLFVFGDARQSV